MIDNNTEYLLQLFQSQIERGHYKRAVNLLDLLSRRLPFPEVDRLRRQIPEPVLTEVELRKLKKSLDTLLYDAECRFKSRMGKHPFLKQGVHDLARQFNFRSVVEYRLDGFFNNDGKRNGYADVVWFKGSTIAVAFEIDSSLREKSIAKLMGINAQYRIWVYYGKKDPSEFVSRLDPAGTVKVIHTSLSSLKTSKQKQVKVKTSPKRRKREKAKVKTPPVDFKRKQEIQDLATRRKIPYLVHFTHACNVSSILKHGLLPRKDLQARLGRQFRMVEINDQKRFDHHLDASCLSISYPNYRMFFRYQQDDPDKCWAVLLINAEVLWKLDCAFCTTNAASTCISSTPLEELKPASALAAMFNDCENGSVSVARSALSIPEFFPTDPQAEVLVFEAIPVEDIVAVHLKERDESSAKYRKTWSSVPVKLSQNYFGPRTDFKHWKNAE